MVRKTIDPKSTSKDTVTSAVLHRHLGQDFPTILEGNGSNLILGDGRRIFDSAGGAAVACIGHGDRRVTEAVIRQMTKVSYCATIFYTTEVCEQLCQVLVDSTNGMMSRAYIVNSGSEAMEAAMKLARQFYLEKSPPEPKRVRFISRDRSYHGITLGALSLGGHKARRAKFEPLLIDGISTVSPCYAYRDKPESETNESYVSRLAAELEDEFIRVGPENVCAFVAEPVVGAALGCVLAVPGYFKAMKDVCNKYGALLIMDEVMCGMGRTGTFHAWEGEGVVPDLQTIGKALGGGYQPIAGLLVGRRVIDVLEAGTGVFVHGQTYQGHPVACAAALEVQRIIQSENLLVNVKEKGQLLGELLADMLSDHPNVGNIRGKGFFWGIEFVEDKTSKKAFARKDDVAMRITELGLTEKYGIAVYPGSGTADGIDGDHIIVAPPYNITGADVSFIARTLKSLIGDFFTANSLAS